MTLPESQPPPLAEEWRALKEVVKSFESAWRVAERPKIDAYLPTNPLRDRVLIELVHIDLEMRLKAGELALVEEYLAQYPELAANHEIALGLIAAEHSFRQRREPTLAYEEYVQRFPGYGLDQPDAMTRFLDDPWDAPSSNAPSWPDTLPTVDGYEVLELIGRGGMGAVYKARQHRLGRNVALKFLPEECIRDPVWLARFRREARTASALNHPYICTIFDTGESGGRPFLSMELVEGHTLEILIRKRLKVEEVARLARQAAQALAAAHAAGVVHRDIKPANLMVRADGILKVLDFGLARQLHGQVSQASASALHNTRKGARVGTLRYMSPEQARAEPLDAATDIFSLGVVIYELVTGQHPFAGDSEIGILHAIDTHTPAPASRLNPEVPAALEALLRHMLSKDHRLRPTAVETDAALALVRDNVTFGSDAPPAPPRRRVTVGRQKEVVILRAGFSEALEGRGSLLCVTGEPGLGKTTLVESFLEDLATDRQDWRLAKGRCSERLAGAEAYLPFLEALDSLLQGEGGAAVAQAMKVLAPTWYVQLAPLATDDPALSAVLAEARQGSQERRKRELGVLLQELSRRQPLVIFLDDVHWADPSSVDLLAYLGGRCAAWPLLLILTYRPSDLLRSQHPFGQVKLELQGRGVCREVALPFLKCEDLSQYLSLAFEGHQFPAEFAPILCSRTEGNPLFVVDLLHYLRDSGTIVQDDHHWTLAQPVNTLHRQWPESVRGMIQRKIDQLSATDRQLLMAAGVQGNGFDSAVVAAVLSREAADVEERLNVLEHVHYLVRQVREHVLPDGTLTVRYSFVHALYQDALYVALQPTRKAVWSAAAARALLTFHGEKSTALAAELAVLFEAGREYTRAADFYLEASRNAAGIFAHHEAVALARRGIQQLASLPESPERNLRELTLQASLGVQLQIVQGYASPEAQRTYTRARALCEQVEDAPKLFIVLWGLWMFYEVSSELKMSWELAQRLLTLATAAHDPAQVLQAHMALSVTSLSVGNPAATVEHTDAAIAIYDPAQHRNHSYLYGQDPLAGCLAFGAVALWLLGYPDKGAQRSLQAVELSAQLGHPTTRGLALYFTSTFRQYCREPLAVQESARVTTAIAIEHGLSLWRANGLIMRGWAMAEQGDIDAGIAMLRQGVANWSATGAETHRTYFLGLLAEALGRGNYLDEAQAVIADAMSRMAGTGTVFHGAELHRLKGEFLLRQHGEEASSTAETCFHEALAIAQAQKAKSLELRAFMSLARLSIHPFMAPKCKPRALRMLIECYNWFTEGFDTADLKDAAALIEQLRRS